MKSRWERFTQSVVALRPVLLALRPRAAMLEDGGMEALVRTLLAMLAVRQPSGAVRVMIPDSRMLELARVDVLGFRAADLVAVAEVKEVAGESLEARAKASRRVAVVAVVIATRLSARAGQALLAAAWARAVLTPARGRAIRCGGYWLASHGSFCAVAT
eukprot:2087703-Pleurochrysis_carterae.AAC.1